MSEMIRLIWKEYRALRGLWLALAIFGLACDAMIFFLVHVPQERLAGCFGFAGVLPVGFALGAGAMLFALEREEATYDFLRCLPVASPRVFVGKVLTALIGTLLLALLLLSVTLNDVRLTVFPHRSLAAIDDFLDEQNLVRFCNGAFDIVLVYALFVMQGIGWSVFFSLQSGRTLLAALLGVLGAITCLSLVHFATEELGFGKLHGTWDAPGLHVIATLAVWSANIWLGSRWLYGRRWSERLRGTDTDALGTYKRLLWQAWRSSYRLLIVILVLGVLVPIVFWPLFIPTTVLGFALLGSCTFLADQERRQFRFFAEHGISPRRLWLSREMFWGCAALCLAAVLLLAHRLFVHFALGLAPSDIQRLWKSAGWIFEPHHYVLWIGLAFTAGQACSMLFQSGVLAAALGVVLAGLLAGWMTFMHSLDIGLWWSVAPLAMALFAATWLRSTGWLLERHTWRTWLPALLVPTMTIAILLVSVPAYRVWEIPAPVTSIEIAPSRLPSAEAALAATRLERLCVPLNFPSTDLLGPLLHPGEAEPAADDLAWLEKNDDVLNEVIAALDKLPPDATIASGQYHRIRFRWDALGAMSLRFGQLAERDDNLQEAWRRYESVFKLAVFVRRGSGATGEAIGDNLVSAAAMQLIRWGARKGQAVARLRSAIAALGRSEADAPPLAEVATSDYLAFIKTMDELEAHPEAADPQGAFLAKWAPWEIERMRRLYRYQFSLNLLNARTEAAARVGGATIGIRAPRASDFAEASGFLGTVTAGYLTEVDILAEWRCSAICYSRAAQLILGAEAWRLEHDELPENLSDLQDPYFKTLPVDPYNHLAFQWFPRGVSTRVRSYNVEELAVGTPFIYSIGPGTQLTEAAIQQSQWMEQSRRSRDEPIVRSLPPSGSSPAPMAGAPASAAAAKGRPSSMTEEPIEYLRGLLFPVPCGP